MHPLGAIGLLALAGVVSAAPAPAPAPPARPEARADADRFAGQLLAVSAQIAEQYVRPVGQDELLYAAAVGIYEAARLPVPPRLRADLREAMGGAAASDDPFRAGRLTGGQPADQPTLARFLADVRLAAGDAEALRGPNALVVACKAMARLLDAHSGVLSAAEYRRAAVADDAAVGYGFEVADYHGVGPCRVVSVHAGSPAQRAGLRPGDEITHVGGRPVAALPASELARLLRAAPDEPGAEAPASAVPPSGPQTLKVTWNRPGRRASRTAELMSERYDVESVFGVTRRDDNTWDYWLDAGRRLGFVRLGALSNGTTEDLHAVLTRLRDDGLRGLLLDLRGCPGGYLREALGCAGLFLGDVPVATLRYRARPETVHRGAGEARFQDFPVVVLVGPDTSGGGELIAAALQDHKRAAVAGQRTLGKASVQEAVSIGLQGIGMKLTSGTFVRPSGKNLHRFPDSKLGDDWGVRPDDGLECRISPGLNRTLRDWWQWQTLRPGTSVERLPLDDPAADPQRQAALQALRAMVDKKR